MGCKSPVTASDDEKQALAELRGSSDRAEAAHDPSDAGWLQEDDLTSGRIAEAFGVREDAVRLGRSDFMRGGVAALTAGAGPVKALAALAVAQDVLSAPVADRVNWTLPRLAREIEARDLASHLALALVSRAAPKRRAREAASPPHAERAGRTPMP